MYGNNNTHGKIQISQIKAMTVDMHVCSKFINKIQVRKLYNFILLQSNHSMT